MKSIEIKGTVRTDVGKKATHELRKNNGVPCVLYGVQKDENGNPVATHFSVTTDGLRNLVYTPHIYVVDLNIDGKIVNAILKDIQFHPVRMQSFTLTSIRLMKLNLLYGSSCSVGRFGRRCTCRW